MGFWDKLEMAAKKFEESANNLEKKADDFLEKNFPEKTPEKPTYSSQKLLSLIKSKAREIAGAQLLEGLKSLNSTTTKLDILLYKSDDVYDGLHIETATIESASSKHPKLSDVQYLVCLKGLVSGKDDYGQLSVDGKYTIELIIDEYSTYIIKDVRVTRRW